MTGVRRLACTAALVLGTMGWASVATAAAWLEISEDNRLRYRDDSGKIAAIELERPLSADLNLDAMTACLAYSAHGWWVDFVSGRAMRRFERQIDDNSHLLVAADNAGGCAFLPSRGELEIFARDGSSRRVMLEWASDQPGTHSSLIFAPSLDAYLIAHGSGLAVIPRAGRSTSASVMAVQGEVRGLKFDEFKGSPVVSRGGALYAITEVEAPNKMTNALVVIEPRQAMLERVLLPYRPNSSGDLDLGPAEPAGAVDLVGNIAVLSDDARSIYVNAAIHPGNEQEVKYGVVKIDTASGKVSKADVEGPVIDGLGGDLLVLRGKTFFELPVRVNPASGAARAMPGTDRVVAIGRGSESRLSAARDVQMDTSHIEGSEFRQAMALGVSNIASRVATQLQFAKVFEGMSISIGNGTKVGSVEVRATLREMVPASVKLGLPSMESGTDSDPVAWKKFKDGCEAAAKEGAPDMALATFAWCTVNEVVQ